MYVHIHTYTWLGIAGSNGFMKPAIASCIGIEMNLILQDGRNFQVVKFLLVKFPLHYY